MKTNLLRKGLGLVMALMVCASMTAINWDSIEWLGDGAGGGVYSNKYKVAAAFGQTVVNIQHPGFAAEDGIYTNFPAGIASCDLPDGKYVIEGAGMVLYLSAFTQKETAVKVVAGGVDYDFTVFFADGQGETGGDEPGDDPGDNPGDLTPATYHGVQSVEVNGAQVVFNWSITRNADATLTFVISWEADIEGAVPQICLNGTFFNMPAANKLAQMTTTNTYEDGATLNDTFFYVAYAGGAARVDITGYTVGASNDDPGNTGSGVENVQTASKAQKVIVNGQVVIIKDGVRYNLLGAVAE